MNNINNPIEQAHPADVALGGRELSRRQQDLLDRLPEYGSQAIFHKRDVSMLDLSAMTAKTGDEFAMFTRGSERMVVRGDKKRVPVYVDDAEKMRNEGYRWSGHTHAGISDASLIVSNGDRRILVTFGQSNSVLYNAAGRRKIFTIKEE